MDADSFLNDLRDDRQTELARLGSSKAVYALTGGEMDGDAVRAGIAAELHELAAALSDWDDADGDAAATFADAAEFAAEYAGSFDGEADRDADGTVVAGALAERTGEGRPAALAAALLVLDELAGQLVGFFVGDADRRSADEFRTFRDDLDDHRDAAAALLDARCEAPADWEAAREVGVDVIGAAYDWYVETLESMGVEPKNVC